MVLGCPSSGNEPRATYRSAAEARAFADRLLGETVEFASLDLVLGRLQCEGKRATVEALLRQVDGFAASGYCESVQAGMASSSTALPVTAERVAVPEKAGCVDPLAWLPPEKARVVESLEQLRQEPHLWEDICVACHRVPAAEEAALAEKLLSTDMAVLVPEAELPRDQAGNLMQGGLFSVGKNDSEDRLIFDRRPENATMPRLDWAALPSAACFTRMLLSPSQFLRASGDDLRNFYYTLRLPPGWVKFNSVGRRVDAGVVQRHGGDPRVPHRLCFRVLGMGDRNGCAIAQATHEAVLQKGGLLRAQETLRYGEPVPQSDVWQGVYIDDLLVTYRQTLNYPIPLDGSFVPPPVQDTDVDMKLMRAAEKIYDKALLKRAVHKAFRGECQFKAWGGEVDGVRGRVGAPREVRRQVWYLIAEVIRQGWASREVLEKINGFLAFAFQFRRELFCLQHRIYTFVSNLPKNRWVRLPGHVLDELRSLSIHVVFAEWDMRRRLHSSLLATDATPTSGGAVRTSIPGPLRDELWRRSEIKGAPVRLDRAPNGEDQKAPDESSAFASACSESLPWAVTASYSFRETSHINLQEARALRRELRKLASDFNSGGLIQLCLNDSLVCVYAFSKGRSSSLKLNNILRGLLPYTIFGNISYALLWVETESNVADYPSRFRELPHPRAAPRWLQHYGFESEAKFVGLEVFSQTSRITAAHREAGLVMEEPLSVDSGDIAFEAVLDRIRDGCLQWVWLGPPSASFSPLRDLCPGGPLRPHDRPEGDENLQEVRWGNQCWRWCLSIAARIARKGGYFVLAHPSGSKAWRMQETQQLQGVGPVRFVRVDMCAYGEPDSTIRAGRGATTLLTNAPWIASNLKRCPGNHNHTRVHGGAAAQRAGVYPTGFVKYIADACCSWASGRASA